jgi:hypothetical protein
MNIIYVSIKITFLCRYGFNDILISQDVVDEDNFLCEFIKQRIIDCFVSEAVANFEDSHQCLNIVRFNL